MPTQTLIESMEKLLALHEQLHETATEKTAAIQHNDMQALTKLLREEQKHLAAIQVADKKRQQAIVQMTNGNQEATMSEILELIHGAERTQLIELQEKLMEVIEELKNANALNQQLLEYSLQFVHLSLDLLAPEPELPNYTKTHDERNGHPSSGRSIFDSKA